jgi:hypothetical protein
MESAANPRDNYTMRLLRMEVFRFQLRQTCRMNAYVNLSGIGLEARLVHETQPNPQSALHVRTIGDKAWDLTDDRT